MATTTPAAPTKSSAHGWRITWPMVLGWLGVLALLWPTLGPYVLGEKHFDAAAGSLILAALLGALTHSPLATQGGGLSKASSSLVVIFALGVGAFTSGCGASVYDVQRHTLESLAHGVDVGDRALAIALVDDCAPAVHGIAAGPERDAALDACIAGHHLDTAIQAVNVADHSLRSAQAAIDVGETTKTSSAWMAIAPCVVMAVREVFAAIAAAGVTLPAEIAGLLAGGESIAGACVPPPTATTPVDSTGGAS